MRMSRREMLQMLAGGALSHELLSGTDNLWGQSSEPPQALALLIGLNEVDPRKYGGWSGKLGGCENDARYYRELAKNNGFFCRSLLRRDASLANAAQHILWASKLLRKGGILFISYSGHGGQMPDTNGDETDDRRDETWCLFDGQVRDDELYQFWRYFEEGVRILMVSDSCHSGSVARVLERAREIEANLEGEAVPRAPGEAAPVERSLPQPEQEVVRERARQLVMRDEQFLQSRSGAEAEEDSLSLFRGMPEAYIDLAYTANEDVYRRTAETIRAGEGAARSLVAATGLLLAACQDSQVAMDTGTNGLYTSRFRDSMGSGTARSYAELIQRITQRMPASQRPNLFGFGTPSSRFLHEEKPFTAAGTA